MNDKVPDNFDDAWHDVLQHVVRKVPPRALSSDFFLERLFIAGCGAALLMLRQSHKDDAQYPESVRNAMTIGKIESLYADIDRRLSKRPRW